MATTVPRSAKGTPDSCTFTTRSPSAGGPSSLLKLGFTSRAAAGVGQKASAARGTVSTSKASGSAARAAVRTSAARWIAFTASAPSA